MDIYEAAVLDYCSAQPGRFIAPQFYIAWAKGTDSKGTGGSQPDFVVLDFPAQTVYVVEVTSASSAKSILARVAERETRWLAPMRKSLGKMHTPLTKWKFHVTLFLREEICSSVRTKLTGIADVSVISLNIVMFPWRWEWHGDVPVNPLQ